MNDRYAKLNAAKVREAEAHKKALEVIEQARDVLARTKAFLEGRKP